MGKYVILHSFVSSSETSVYFVAEQIISKLRQCDHKKKITNNMPYDLLTFIELFNPVIVAVFSPRIWAISRKGHTKSLLACQK